LSQEPKVTRFGADPTVPQELATKAYVDSGGGGSGAFLIGAAMTSNGTHSNDYHPIFVTQSWSTIRTERSQIITFAFTLTRLRLKIRINTSNGATPVSFNEDNVDLGTITVPASATGAFDSGALTDSVAAGSDISIHRDTTSSSAGTFQFMPCTAECQS